MIQISCEEWEVISTYEIIKHMINAGFQNINEFSLFDDGKPFYYNNKKICIAFKQENYEKLDFSLEENMIAVARLIAEFHKHAEGFDKPTGIRIKTEWGKLIEKYKIMISKLNKYYDKAYKRNTNNDAFTAKMIEYKENILMWADAANQVFQSDLYIDLLEHSMRNKEIGISTINEDTVIKVDNQLKLSGIFDVSYNMAIEDVGRLLRKYRVMVDNCISINEEIILREYQKIRPIGNNELVMIKAIADFPYECIKIILKYAQDNSKEKQLLEKFTKAYEKELKIKTWGGNHYGL